MSYYLKHKKINIVLVLLLLSILSNVKLFSQSTVSGTVWNDLDGSANGTFTNIATGAETGTNGNGTLFVYVVNSANEVVVATSSVAANGTYSSTTFTGVANAYLILDTVTRAVGFAFSNTSSGNMNGVKLPAGWSATSPIMTTNFVVNTGSNPSRNFGIQNGGFSALSSYNNCAGIDSLFTWYFRGGLTNLTPGTTIVENSGSSTKLPFFKVTARYSTSSTHNTGNEVARIYAPASYSTPANGGGNPVPASLGFVNRVLEIGGDFNPTSYTDSILVSVAFKTTNGNPLYLQKISNALLDIDTWESFKVVGFNNGVPVKVKVYASNNFNDNATNDVRSFYNSNNRAWIYDVSSGFQASEGCAGWCDYNYNAYALLEFDSPIDSITFVRQNEPLNMRNGIGAVSNIGSDEITSFKYCPINISGILWNDVNANGVKDAAETNILSSGMFVNLVDEYGRILASAPLQADGSYSFTGLPQLVTSSPMKVQLSATQGVVGALPPSKTAPSGYQTISENAGGSSAELGVNANGEINLPLILATNYTNYNFGVVQSGFIYLHKRALDESSSLAFDFSITGASGPITMTLNDNPTSISIRDIGASESGRLWATAFDGKLYYKSAGSSTWVQTGATNAQRVDGGAGDFCYYTDNFGNLFKFDGVFFAQILNSGAVDVGSAWDDRPYVVSGGRIYRYSGTGSSGLGGASWPQHNPVTTVGSYIDGDPSSPDIPVIANQNREIWKVPLSGASVGIAAPTPGSPFDVAVDATGNVFAYYQLITAQTDGSVYKAAAGATTFGASELTSRQVSPGGASITAWVKDQAWEVVNKGSVAPHFNNYGTIFTRSLNGSTVQWIDDERVRVGGINANAEVVAVVPGTYTITENLPSGWDLIRINTFDPTSNTTTNLPTNTTTVNVTAGEVVHVEYVNALLQPFAMTNSCATKYEENFGTGTAGTFGPALTGQTDYHYFGTGTSQTGEDGYYKIVTRTNPDFSAWATALFDHTSGNGTGNMYVVNAGYDANEFFRRRFTGLVPGATYDFSAWIASFYAPSLVFPNVSFKVLDPVTGAVLNSNTTGNITTAAQWNKYTLSFTPTSTSVDLVLQNNNIGGVGNDLAIDDISFAMQPVSTPITTIVAGNCTSGATITVTSPVGASYEYSKDGTNWQTSVNFTNLAPGNFIIYARFAGTTGCEATKVDIVRPNICGTIFNDLNGSTDNNVNGTGTNIGGQLHVNLLDGSGNVVATVPVNADGTYSFSGVLPGTYSIQLNQTVGTVGQPAPTQVLPTGWVNTGDEIGSTQGASPNGRTESITVLATSNVVEVNLGIQRLPESAVNNQTIGLNPGGTVNTTVNPTWFQNSNVGANPNTQDYDGGTVDSIRITAFPTNATSITIGTVTYYPNAGAIPGGTCPTATCAVFPVGGVTIVAPGGVPSLPISVDPIDGLVTVVIPFVSKDNSGNEDPTPGSVTLVYTNILAINYVSFTAVKKDNSVQINFTVAGNAEGSVFTIERGSTSNSLQAIKGISGTQNLSYSFIDNQPNLGGRNFYRIKEIDKNGKITYSEIRVVNFGTDFSVKIYPTPAKSFITIDVSNASINQPLVVSIYNTAGQRVLIKKINSFATTSIINVERLNNGIYSLRIEKATGELISTSKVIVLK